MPPDIIAEFMKELSGKVRWSSGHGQYPPDSPEALAYRDGVETAIGMMYIDLTGGVKNKGMLHTLIANIGRELEARCEIEKEELDHSRYCVLKQVPKEIASCGCWMAREETIDRTITIIRSITGISPTR